MSKVISKLGVTIQDNTCSCWLQIYFDYVSHTWANGGGIKLHKEDCSGAVLTWQYFNNSVSGSSWQSIAQTNPGVISDSLYDPFIAGGFGSGLYRVKYVVPNCGDFYSNILEMYIA